MGTGISVLTACKNGNLSLLKEAFEQADFELEAQDAYGRTGLLLVCNQEPTENDDLLAMLHELEPKAVNFNHKDEKGWTALHYVCYRANYQLLDFLIDKTKVIRDNVGLLPQDYGEDSTYYDKLTLKQPNTNYKMKLYSLRPSGIIQLRLGSDCVQSGSVLTIEYDVPETHSVKDFIQLIYFESDETEPNFGAIQYVPEGSNGTLLFQTETLPVPCIVRFLYIKCDVNSMSRQVVATGCNASIVYFVDESVEFDLHVFNRVLEIESIPDLLFDEEPSIMLKRIGIPAADSQEIEWASINHGNYILAVNGEVIAGKDFDEAIEMLQNDSGTDATLLRLHNVLIRGDFIPEKALGPGIIGKFAELGRRHDSLAGSWDEQEFHNAVSSPSSLIELKYQISNGKELMQDLSKGLNIK